jgi:hypothetical protein
MGRIVTIILEKKIYLEQILPYPLTPVPMCFAHMNGKTNKTTKSTLFKELENWPPRKNGCKCRHGFSHVESYAKQKESAETSLKGKCSTHFSLSRHFSGSI